MPLPNNRGEGGRDHCGGASAVLVRTLMLQTVIVYDSWPSALRRLSGSFKMARNLLAVKLAITSIRLEHAIESAARQAAILGEEHVAIDLLVVRENVRRRRWTASASASSGDRPYVTKT